MNHSSKNSIKALILSAAAAYFFGVLIGALRYWLGFYVMLQGILSALGLSLLIHKTVKTGGEIFTEKTFKTVLLLFLVFTAGGFSGFGLSQPWFAPLSWIFRVVNGNSSEAVFGIYSKSGLIHNFFSDGLSGGFWLFLNLFDSAFFFFFLLISLPFKKRKGREK